MGYLNFVTARTSFTFGTSSMITTPGFKVS